MFFDLKRIAAGEHRTLFASIWAENGILGKKGGFEAFWGHLGKKAKTVKKGRFSGNFTPFRLKIARPPSPLRFA